MRRGGPSAPNPSLIEAPDDVPQGLVLLGRRSRPAFVLLLLMVVGGWHRDAVTAPPGVAEMGCGAGAYPCGHVTRGGVGVLLRSVTIPKSGLTCVCGKLGAAACPAATNTSCAGVTPAASGGTTTRPVRGAQRGGGAGKGIHIAGWLQWWWR